MILWHMFCQLQFIKAAEVQMDLLAPATMSSLAQEAVYLGF